ncbi:MAG: hypothetical protein PUB63_08920, partial [Clostridia bacterium]|nr:hypothetical protein [Clostridia bacterium]
ALAELSIPDSIAVISEKAFEGCKKLVINISPEKYMAFPKGVFHGCRSVNVPLKYKLKRMVKM